VTFAAACALTALSLTPALAPASDSTSRQPASAAPAVRAQVSPPVATASARSAAAAQRESPFSRYDLSLALGGALALVCAGVCVWTATRQERRPEHGWLVRPVEHLTVARR
jgi:hypothetical protein